MKKGFTLTELLAVILILGILLIIVVPSYINISDSVKESNLKNIKDMVSNSMLNYANKEYLDDIKQSNDNCSTNDCCVYYSIDFIKGMYIFQTTNGVITNPVTNEDLTGYVKISYNTDNYELNAEYKENLNDCGYCRKVEIDGELKEC